MPEQAERRAERGTSEAVANGTKINELQRLRHRVEELEELLGLNERLPSHRIDAKITAQLLGLLLRRECVSITTIEIAIGKEDCCVDWARTRIFLARRWCRNHEITIHNRWGVGYFISATDKPKLRALLQGSMP